MKTVLIIFGTRPEAIKLAPVISRLVGLGNGWDIVTCFSGQHKDMANDVIRFFEIPITFRLDVMTEGQSLPSLSAKLLKALSGVVKAVKPDIALVHGDTTTAFVGALSCFYERVPVFHVEAGLRTDKLDRPFPEEANRQLVGRLAFKHFAATEKARSNLLSENILPTDIELTGNTVVDALYSACKKIDLSSSLRCSINSSLIDSGLPLGPNQLDYVLITGHRRENFGQGFINVCEALLELAYEFNQVYFVYPVHLNPQVRGPVRHALGGVRNILLIEPQPYENFVTLMRFAKIILTDSGGIQEEAPSLGKPVLVMRDTTERPEAIIAGAAMLVGTERETIVRVVRSLLVDKIRLEEFLKIQNPYGDGRASQRIADSVREFLNA